MAFGVLGAVRLRCPLGVIRSSKWASSDKSALSASPLGRVAPRPQNPGLNVTWLGRRTLPEIYRLHYHQGIPGQWLVGYSAVAERHSLPDSGFVAGGATRANIGQPQLFNRTTRGPTEPKDPSRARAQSKKCVRRSMSLTNSLSGSMSKPGSLRSTFNVPANGSWCASESARI